MKKVKKLYSTRVGKIVVSFTIGASLAFVIIVGAAIAFGLLYNQKIYPGIYAGGVNIGGMSREDAEARLRQAIDNPDSLIPYGESGI